MLVAAVSTSDATIDAAAADAAIDTAAENAATSYAAGENEAASYPVLAATAAM